MSVLNIKKEHGTSIKFYYKFETDVLINTLPIIALICRMTSYQGVNVIHPLNSQALMVIDFAMLAAQTLSK